MSREATSTSSDDVTDGNLRTSLTKMHDNEDVSVHVLSLWFTLLDVLDDYFVECRNGGTIPAGRTASFALVQASYSYWVASVSLTLSGLLAPAYAEMRAVFESMLYAFYCRDDEARQIVWLERNDSQKAKQLERGMFGNVRAMRRELASARVLPVSEESLEELYDSLVDRGAHPNATGTLQNMGHDGGQILTKLFNCGGLDMRRALNYVAETGYAAARVSRFLLQLPLPPLDIPKWIQSLAQIPLAEESDPTSSVKGDARCSD